MALVEKASTVTACELQRTLKGRVTLYNLGQTSYEKKISIPKKSSRRSSRTRSRQPTPCQRDRRVNFSFLAGLWKGLSGAQRSAWGALALLTPFVNECGTIYFLSPYRMFVKVNGVLLNFGAGFMVYDPPANYAPPTSMLAYTLSYTKQDYFEVPVLMANFTVSAALGISFLVVVPRALTRAPVEIPAVHLFSSISSSDTL